VTTILSQKGQIVLPASVRDQLDLHPGDDFEISIEDDDTIVLRRISRPPNAGLVAHLLASPGDLEIPPRQADTRPIPNFGDED
jgi:AbrB family looped-hinge helix DNA binding protein